MHCPPLVCAVKTTPTQNVCAISDPRTTYVDLNDGHDAAPTSQPLENNHWISAGQDGIRIDRRV